MDAVEGVARLNDSADSIHSLLKERLILPVPPWEQSSRESDAARGISLALTRGSPAQRRRRLSVDYGYAHAVEPVNERLQELENRRVGHVWHLDGCREGETAVAHWGDVAVCCPACLCDGFAVILVLVNSLPERLGVIRSDREGKCWGRQVRR